MHQSHNIPWHILPTHFKVVYDDKQVTPPRSHITPKNSQDPALQPSLVHFIRKFTTAIRTFSDTERQKYPPTFDTPTSGPLFSDALIEKYPEYLNKRNQDIAYWIARAQQGGGHYGTFHGELADVIKVLIHEDEMAPLLMLARHPLTPIADLHNLSWGHTFGWSRSKEEALSAYLFFNAAEALELMQTGDYTRLDIYPELLRTLQCSMDYPGQQVTHREFFKDIGLQDAIENSSWGRPGEKEEAMVLAVHHDYERFQRYIKQTFEVLYRYDALARECGFQDGPSGKLNWDVDIARTYPFMWVVKVEQEYLQEEDKWLVYLKGK
ncbi:hypothetical protein BJ165DRAFT_1411114 [Panaeolus papilionaceus]|nr:hypothetical protein BJ165DRAFT_1411114 [Panaeolus papilionaceus]